MDPVTATATAKAVYEAYKAYNEERKEDAFRQEVLEKLRELLTAIKELQHQIQAARLADFKGRVNGLLNRYNDYARYDRETRPEQWQFEQERLREIIDDAADAEENLEAELDRLNLDTELLYALEVFTLYSSLILMRASAMHERTDIYGTTDADNIPGMIEEAKEYAGRISKTLRKASDSRYSPDITYQQTVEGERMYGWRFNGKFYDAGVGSVFFIPPGPKVTKLANQAMKEAREALQKAKDDSFKKYPGTEAVLLFLGTSG